MPEDYYDDSKLKPGWAEKAQKILRRANLRVINECDLRYRGDLFIFVAMASVSAVITEIVDSAKIMEEGGIDDIVKHTTNDFERMLREDLAERLDYERKITRQ